MPAKPLKIAVTADDVSLLTKAKALATQLALDFNPDNKIDYDFLLIMDASQLKLQMNGVAAPGPLAIDFLSGTLRQRLQKNPNSELIARAVGFHPQKELLVLDATAGLGRDGFLLATLGCKVLMLERSPIIAALLEDGLHRALANSAFNHLKIHLITTDAISYLQHLTPDDYPDVVYLDPMFPARTKSALVKKEMQYLQALLGEDKDIESLFAIAIKRAKKRVVLKRPRLAPPFNAVKPDIQYKGKDSRFDVYLIQRNKLS